MNVKGLVNQISEVNIFTEAKKQELFVGRPYSINFDSLNLVCTDAWKNRVGGIPAGTLLLAFYENENDDVQECLLLRVLKPAPLPTDSDVVSSMINYYKDDLKTSGPNSQLDDYSRYNFSFSGIQCRILGTYYIDSDKELKFGADVENFYAAHNYAVYKPKGKVLEKIINFKDGLVQKRSERRIGKMRYSSTTRFQEKEEDVPVYVTPLDFLGKRTALFGMTRTGKSNTVKKIIEATTDISEESTELQENDNTNGSNLPSLTEEGLPSYKVGQIIFDMNGEYANANEQDEGTAIFKKFNKSTYRYSVNEKQGFKVMKTNFYQDINAAMQLISRELANDSSDYVKKFLTVNFESPDKNDRSAYNRYLKKTYIFKCCLYQAGFNNGTDKTINVEKNNLIGKDIRDAYVKKANYTPDFSKMSYDELTDFWLFTYDNQEDEVFKKYKDRKHHDWLDEDMKALLRMLSAKRSNVTISGFRKLSPCIKYHSSYVTKPFEQEILEYVRKGGIVIIDLSQGDPVVQQTYSERLCKYIFSDAMSRFIQMKPNNFIQFYFEEAHNLFPKKEDKDLSQIYNRIAKEGAKLNLGIIYATQEVSSISANILKNTQNWFISHLNNEDELREIRKYYDFADFCDNLIRFSSSSDKGFVRMKTYSNAFVIPAQIDKFTVGDCK